MRKALVLLVLIILAFTCTVAVSGCTQSSIQNPDQASAAITGISQDVSNVGDILEDVDRKLG